MSDVMPDAVSEMIEKAKGMFENASDDDLREVLLSVIRDAVPYAVWLILLDDKNRVGTAEKHFAKDVVRMGATPRWILRQQLIPLKRDEIVVEMSKVAMMVNMITVETLLGEE